MARREKVVKRYVVRLSAEERAQLDALIWKGKSPAQRLLKARILLKADVSEAGEGWSDSRIMAALETSASMVYRVRKQLVEEGLEAALSRKQRATPAVAPIFDGERCSFSWNRDPATGLIFIQSGPLAEGPHWPPGCWEAEIGMLVVETIAKIRRAYFSLGKPIKEICRELRVSRKVVRKVIRSDATEFHYERSRQPLPRIGPWRERLENCCWRRTRASPLVNG